MRRCEEAQQILGICLYWWRWWDGFSYNMILIHDHDSTSSVDQKWLLLLTKCDNQTLNFD